ncbi:MAG: alpha/beta family hydrolase [Rhodospirillaceae bacterium]
MTDFLFDGPAQAAVTVALAHGAGAPMDSDFMRAVAQGLAGHGIRVARFEFPYMAKSRADGRRRPPDRMPVLMETYLEVCRALGPERLVVSGKSMGGRVASMIADEACIAGLVCLGYPFHPPGKPEKLRTEHLETLKTPALILQGERDPFGSRDEVAAYRLSESVAVEFLPDGDHDFRPRRASGRSREDNRAEAVERMAAFASACRD